MSITVNLDANQNIRMSEEVIETQPPDEIEFSAEGVVTMTKELLGKFEGQSLNPVRVDISVDDSRTVETDLVEAASLRLESVDVGVETPDIPDGTPERSSAGSLKDSAKSVKEGKIQSTDGGPGAIAFTVEGTISGVPPKTLEPVMEGSPKLQSITLAVDDAVRSDGGDGSDVLLEFTLLGYGVVVHRHGTIEVVSRNGRTDIGLT